MKRSVSKEFLSEGNVPLCGAKNRRRRFFEWLRFSASPFLSKETTTSVNGLFILVVFFSHMQVYIELPAPIHGVTAALGQLMVAMFLFYSGYGVGCSVQKKGMEYVHRMPRRRILQVLLRFVPAVFLYALLDVVCGIPFTGREFALSLIAWENLGNSNWYIFVILGLYLVTWLACEICGKCVRKSRQETASFLVMCLLSAVLFFFLHETKESWWYNTMTAYPFGYFVALTREKWERILDGKLAWAGTTLVSFVLVLLLRPVSRHASLYLLMTVLYCILILCLTKKVPVYHPVLYWLGSHLFEIYILMRIPMIFLQHIQVAWIQNPLVFTVFSLAATLFLAYSYHRSYEFLASRLAR